VRFRWSGFHWSGFHWSGFYWSGVLLVGGSIGQEFHWSGVPLVRGSIGKGFYWSGVPLIRSSIGQGSIGWGPLVRVPLVRGKVPLCRLFLLTHSTGTLLLVNKSAYYINYSIPPKVRASL
jgi:hypothetical protein